MIFYKIGLEYQLYCCDVDLATEKFKEFCDSKAKVNCSQCMLKLFKLAYYDGEEVDLKNGTFIPLGEQPVKGEP